jgi:hypothetical protein
MSPATAAIVGSLPASKAGVGSAMNDVTRGVGGAVGIAVLGSIAPVLYRNDIAATVSRLPAGIRSAVEESIGSAVAAGATGPAAAAVEAAQQAFTAAIQAVLLLAAALMAAGSLLYLRMHRAHRGAVPLPPQVRREPQVHHAPTETHHHAPTPGTCVPCAR